jgi:molybdenum cofactor biosynthesis enzyme MoaA
MCNGELSSTIRKRQGRPALQRVYDDRFFDELREFLPHVQRVQFKGGEPFLGEENRRVWDLMMELGLEWEVTITTNGTVWNDRVEHIVRTLRVDPIISVDGVSPEVFNGIRVGADCATVWANVERFQAVAEEVGRHVTVSFCLMTNNWHELPQFLAEVDRRGLNCFVIHVNQPAPFDLFRLPPTELGAVLAEIESCGSTLTTEPAQREWSKVVTRLRSQLDNPVTLRVRVIDPQWKDPQVNRQAERRLRQDAATWGGRPPLVVTAVEGTVAACDAPEWASYLEPERWIGRAEESMPEFIGNLLGVRPVFDVRNGPMRGVVEILLELVGAPEPTTLRILTAPVVGDDEAAGAATERWFISERRA